MSPSSLPSLLLNLFSIKAKRKPFTKGELDMRKTREMYDIKKPKEREEFDEDEKKVSKHLSHDIKESKKSIHEDKELRKKLGK